MLMMEKVVKLFLVEWIPATTRVTIHMSQSLRRDTGRLVLFLVLSSKIFFPECMSGFEVYNLLLQFNMGDVLVDGKSTGTPLFLFFVILTYVNEKYN